MADTPKLSLRAQATGKLLEQGESEEEAQKAPPLQKAETSGRSQCSAF